MSTRSDTDNEILLYALHHTQSDTTFILAERLNALDVVGEPVQLKLSILASKSTVIQSCKLTGFRSSKKIPLPGTYTREFIPANRSHIPTPETARVWPHLKHISEEIAPLINCDIWEIISGEDNQPFCSNDRSWLLLVSIIGCGNSNVDYENAIGVSHKIIARQVTLCVQSSSPDLTNKVQYICRTQVKEHQKAC